LKPPLKSRGTISTRARLAQHIPRIAERFVGVRSMTVLVLDPLTEDAMDGVTRADLQGVVAPLNFGGEALLL
jgi:hypothetical protein